MFSFPFLYLSTFLRRVFYMWSVRGEPLLELLLFPGCQASKNLQWKCFELLGIWFFSSPLLSIFLLWFSLKLFGSKQVVGIAGVSIIFSYSPTKFVLGMKSTTKGREILGDIWGLFAFTLGGFFFFFLLLLLGTGRQWSICLVRVGSFCNGE